MRLRMSVGIALMAIALVGCGSREKDVLGLWSAQQNGKTMKMEIKADKTWAADLPIRKDTVPFVGTWVMNGEVIRMTPTMLNGQPVERIRSAIASQPNLAAKQPLEELIRTNDFELSADGATLTLKGVREGLPVLTFKKNR